MSEPALQLAKAAREQLSAALNALQTNAQVPDELMAVADPIAEAMSVLHRVERSKGTDLSGRDVALKAVRTALDSLQKVTTPHPVTDVIMEHVAMSLAKVNALARYQPPAAPAPAPVVPAAPAIGPMGTQMISPIPRQPAAQPQAHPPQPQPPQSFTVPVAQPPQPAFALQQQLQQQQLQQQQLQQQQLQQQQLQQQQLQQQQLQQQQLQQQQLQQQQLQQQQLQQQQLQRQQLQQQQLQQQQRASAALQQAANPYAPAAPAVNPYAAPVQQPAARPQQPAQPQAASASAGGQSAGKGIDVELGTNSGSNFYKGLGGNDVIEHGGLFVATYKVPPIGATVALRVHLPGDLEFQANAVVQWTRESGGAGESAEPGFGARFTQISAEGRQLVYRYTRNREPIFYDDL